MREIDPKTLKKAAPRPPPYKPIESVPVIPDFSGNVCITGKVGDFVSEGTLSVWAERLDATAVTSTYSHPKKVKTVAVIHGELTIHSGEDYIVLKVGESFEIPRATSYKLEAKSGPCIFFNIQDPTYSSRLKIDNTTEQSGVPLESYTPAHRVRGPSKAIEQLRAMNGGDVPQFREGPISGDPGVNDMPMRLDDGGFI
jgi:mannose-6-phosphate isomerase-like protein (cupin superfamily)